MALNVAAGLALMAIGALAWFVWNLAHRHRSSRGQELGGAGPSTMELGEEPPAVVNLLVNRLDPTDDALAATVLDLAARGHIEVIELSPEHHLLRPRTRDRDPVAGFESIVLEALGAAVDEAGTATVDALGRSLGPGSVRTWARFRAGVVADATRRGLVAQPTTAALSGPLVVFSSIVAVGGFVIVPQLWLFLPFLWVGLLLAGILIAVRGRSLDLTDAGRAAGERWLGVRRYLEDHGTFEQQVAGAVAVWDRYLAYATAFGLSDRAGQGVVRELRTSISMADVRAGAAVLRAGMRAQRDPNAYRGQAAMLIEHQYGPGTPPDALLGPGGGDFLALLRRTAKGLVVVQLLSAYEPDLVRATCQRRIDELAAAAPPEVQDDVARLRPHAVLLVEQLVGGAPLRGPLDGDAASHAAAERVLQHVARALGVAPDGAAVLQALSGA